MPDCCTTSHLLMCHGDEDLFSDRYAILMLMLFKLLWLRKR